MSVMEDTAFLMTGSRELAIALAALLQSIPPLRYVERIRGADAFLERLAKEKQPKLAVLDAGDLGPATPRVVITARTIAPETRCLVLSDSLAEVRELTSRGVESVVVKGVDPQGLVGAIEILLSEGDAGRA